MGIDYGTRRVGISLSDEGGAMAFPHSVIPNTKDLVEVLSSLVLKEKVGAIVFGKSHTLGGKDNPVAEGAAACAAALGDISHTPVYFESEVFTTQEAIREQGRNDMTDAAAATIILNSYLSRIKHTT
jgi:putative Holliday junction resolvase